MLHHPVPDQHLKSIGNITVSFARLELLIESFIWSLLNDKQRIGQIITAELSFKQLRALLMSLFTERYGNENAGFETLKELMVRAGQIEEKRNFITHSVWGAGKDKDLITRLKTTAKEKHGIKFQFEDLSADNLSAFAVEIQKLSDDVQKYWISLIESGKAISHHATQRLP